MQLVVTVCLLPLSSLGDIVGYRRVYRIGMVIFTIGSLGCALEPVRDRAADTPWPVAVAVMASIAG